MEKKRANYLSFLGSKTVERWVRTRATKADLGKSHCCLHQPVALPVALSPALGRHSPLLAMHVRQDNPSSNSCRRSQKQPTPSTATPHHGPVTRVVLQEQRASIWDTGTPPYRRDLCDGDERQRRDEDATATAATHRPFCLIFNRKWRHHLNQSSSLSLMCAVGDGIEMSAGVLEGWVCKSPSLARLQDGGRHPPNQASGGHFVMDLVSCVLYPGTSATAGSSYVISLAEPLSHLW